MKRLTIIIAIVAALAVPATAFAEVGPANTSETAQIQNEIGELTARINQLEIELHTQAPTQLPNRTVERVTISCHRVHHHRRCATRVESVG